MSEQRRPAGHIRAGIIGAGLMGTWHADAVRRVGGQVVAVFDQDPAAAQRLAARFPGAQARSELALDELALDVCHICTPPESHVALAEAALAAGRHVLIEKPLAPTLAETQHLLDLAAAQNLLLCPVHQYPFQDGVQQVRRRLRQLAPLVAFHHTVRSAGGVGRTTEEVAQIAAGILPHFLSLVAALLPVELAAIEWQVVQPRAGEWLVSGNAQGIGLTLTISMAGRPPVNVCEVVGAGGTATMDLFHGFARFEGGHVSRLHKIWQPFGAAGGQLWAAGLNLGRRAVRREPAYPGLRPLIAAFYAALRSEGTSPILATETLAIAQAWEQIQQQAREGAAV